MARVRIESPRYTSSGGAFFGHYFVVVLIWSLLLLRYLWTIRVPWFKDDFLLVQLASRQNFFDIWSFDDAIGNAYRPVARSLYFWLGLRLFNYRFELYHVANLLIAMAGVAYLYLLSKSLFNCGSREADDHGSGPAFACALLYVVHPAIATPLTWICGIQDLLMATLSLAAIYYHAKGRQVLYVVLFVAALLSKEQVALLPSVVFLYDMKVKRIDARRALQFQIVPLCILLLWSILNPWLPWNRTVPAHIEGQPIGFVHLDPAILAFRCIFAAEPVQGFDWIYKGYQTLLMMVVLALAALVNWKSTWPKRRCGRLSWIALAWTASGILPLLAINSCFVYYAYYPAIGAIIAFVALLVSLGNSAGARILRTLSIGVASLYLTMAVGNVHTLSQHDVHSIRRASKYLVAMKADLQRMHPVLPPGARCFFWNVPEHIGLIVGEGSAMATWYQDNSIEGKLLGQYSTEHSRQSFFFLHDQDGHLLEIIPGSGQRTSDIGQTKYADGYSDVGACFAKAGELDAAKVEFQKALAIMPSHPMANAGLGIAMTQSGHYLEAIPILERAMRLSPSNQGVAVNLQIARMHTQSDAR